MGILLHEIVKQFCKSKQMQTEIMNNSPFSLFNFVTNLFGAMVPTRLFWLDIFEKRSAKQVSKFSLGTPKSRICLKLLIINRTWFLMTLPIGQYLLSKWLAEIESLDDWIGITSVAKLNNYILNIWVWLYDYYIHKSIKMFIRQCIVRTQFLLELWRSICSLESPQIIVCTN